MIRCAGECVEDATLRVFVDQRLRLMLSVQVHEPTTNLGKARRSRGGVVDPCAGAARDSHFAAQHDATLLELDAALIEHPLDIGLVGDVEHALDHRAIGAGANEVSTGAFPEEQTERADDDGLPRARFAGKDIESRRQRQRQRLNDGEVANAQLGQHYSPSSRSRSPPHPSFRRSTEKNVVSEKRTRTTEASARRTTRESPGANIVPTWPSIVTRSSSGPSSARTVTSESAGTTSGRIARVCGEIGVVMIRGWVGRTTGPPADRLYAVDPVGVEMMTPSAA